MQRLDKARSDGIGTALRTGKSLPFFLYLPSQQISIFVSIFPFLLLLLSAFLLPPMATTSFGKKWQFSTMDLHQGMQTSPSINFTSPVSFWSRIPCFLCFIRNWALEMLPLLELVMEMSGIKSVWLSSLPCPLCIMDLDQLENGVAAMDLFSANDND